MRRLRRFSSPHSQTGPRGSAPYAAKRGLLVAPAGFGKTEVIAKAVAHHADLPQLILTHTHAGVRALRHRLARFGAPRGSFHLDTIAGFSLRYAASFPRISGVASLEPVGNEWTQTYSAATRVLDSRIGASIVTGSFNGVFVDEYQDCTPSQHALVLRLAELVPTRVVGDPLQGIFDFEEIVDWDADVYPSFDRLDDLQHPWRWRKTNPDLGDWLLELRKNLLEGERTSLKDAPVTWKGSIHPAEQLEQCKVLAEVPGSVVAIRKWAAECHKLARNLRGAYSSMEEIESRDLLKYAEKLEAASGTDRSDVLFGFATLCMTRISNDFGSMRKTISSGGKAKMPSKGPKRAVVEALRTVVVDGDLKDVSRAMDAIERASTGDVYRRELWADMHRSIEAFETSQHDSLAKAAWTVRDQGRHHGRKVDQNVLSRTLLVKGLEFDHALVLDASELEPKHLYVAMTRGSKSLTVLSEIASV